jgi:osmoprotectant transport system permease protein
MQTVGIGSIPTFLVLVALAIPPMVTNTYAGVNGVDPEAVDAARGMGMSGGQLLRRVEMPLASPLIMAGIRTSAVAVVATATLAAVVGWGGLGRYIYDGSRVHDYERLFAGALLVALLANAVELLLAVVQHFVVPRGMRVTKYTKDGNGSKGTGTDPGIAPGSTVPTAAVEPGAPARA